MGRAHPKAEFQVNLTTTVGAVALSNMPQVSKQQLPGSPAKEKHVFLKTPLMPTYTLAIAVGDLQRRTRFVETAEGMKPISLWATPMR